MRFIMITLGVGIGLGISLSHHYGLVGFFVGFMGSILMLMIALAILRFFISIMRKIFSK
jgi:hypothetical protein